jgi:hypothetical protein
MVHAVATVGGWAARGEAAAGTAEHGKAIATSGRRSPAGQSCAEEACRPTG